MESDVQSSNGQGSNGQGENEYSGSIIHKIGEGKSYRFCFASNRGIFNIHKICRTPGFTHQFLRVDKEGQLYDTSSGTMPEKCIGKDRDFHQVTQVMEMLNRFVHMLDEFS